MAEIWPGLSKLLEGRLVRLEPLIAAHEEPLWAVTQHAEVWALTAPGVDTSRESFASWFAEALEATRAGTEAAFATVSRETAKPIGSTRFLRLRPEDRGLEIGWTWLTPSAWRTGANVEAKLLQMTHAFEALGCMRVELKTHVRNERSRGAMEALGASFEGVFRKHRLIPGHGVRDSAWYSVIDDEWPAVKDGLERRLASLRAGR